MQKILTFLCNLPARFPLTSGVISLYLSICILTWLLAVGFTRPGPGDPGGSAGNIALLLHILVSAAGQLAILLGKVALIADLCLIFLLKKPFSPSLKMLFSTLCWLSLLLGFYPFLVMNESTLKLQSKASQAVETVRYTYLANPDTRLQHELDKGDTINVLNCLEEGANINIQSSQGNTPLMIAIQNQDFALATELIRRGASVDPSNQWGQSALDNLLNPTHWQPPTHTGPAPEKADLALLLIENGAQIRFTRQRLFPASQWGCQHG